MFAGLLTTLSTAPSAVMSFAASSPLTVVRPGGGTRSRSYVPPGYCPGCYSRPYSPVFPILATLFVLALIAAVIVFIVLLVRRNAAYRKLQAQLSGPAQQAQLILAERMARGDIDVAEYRQRMDALRAGPGFAPPPQG